MSEEYPPCEHADQMNEVTPSTTEGCEECLKIGGTWVHLRMCMECGKVGCCDSSPNTHATKHYQETQHAIISSREPDEDWFWCNIDEKYLLLD